MWASQFCALAVLFDSGVSSVTMSQTSLPDWLSYLERLHPKAIELGLERINRVRQRMELAPEFLIITVGGTNGKGSTCAMLERILREAGYRVGCYTSPHLLRYNERVRVAGEEASDDQLCQAFEMVEHARGDIPLTYFEFGTLAAIWHFVASGIDVAILEIGLGGRLDAVNAFEPDCAIITSIDLDHQDYLGNTREKIGLEKAGIYRAGVPAICGDPCPPTTVSERALNISAEYLQIGRDFGYEPHGRDWVFWNKTRRIEGLPLPALSGSFQLSNAASAIEALSSLESRLPVAEQHIREGLSHVTLPGRFQVLRGTPELVLDVAHNPHAAKGLVENLRRTRREGSRTLAVFGMLGDKDIGGVVQVMAPEIDQWFVAGIDHFRGISGEELGREVSANAPQARIAVFNSVAEALAQACRSAGGNDRITAFGSFYTVADVLRALPITGIGSYGC